MCRQNVIQCAEQVSGRALHKASWRRPGWWAVRKYDACQGKISTGRGADNHVLHRDPTKQRWRAVPSRAQAGRLIRLTAECSTEEISLEDSSLATRPRMLPCHWRAQSEGVTFRGADLIQLPSLGAPSLPLRKNTGAVSEASSTLRPWHTMLSLFWSRGQS